MKCCPKYWDSHSRYNEAEEVKNHNSPNPTINKTKIPKLIIKSNWQKKKQLKQIGTLITQITKLATRKEKPKHSMARAP